MLTNWTAEFATCVTQHRETILHEPLGQPEWKVEVTRQINGIPAYADLGGVIALTVSGEFVSYDPELRTVAPVQDALWRDVALASVIRQYPDLRGLMPARPALAATCPDCSGSGWTMEGRMFCGKCRGKGWVE